MTVGAGTLGNVVTIPPSVSDIVVRVYTGTFKHAPAVFNATLKDHAGKELAVIGHKWGATTTAILNQVFTVRVAPDRTNAAAVRSLEVVWSAARVAGGSNIEYTSVAVSSQNATAASGAGLHADAAAEAAPASFVILQAAQLK